MGLINTAQGFDADESDYNNARPTQWNCRRILVTDTDDGKTYVFNINQWILLTDSMTKSNGFSARPAELHLAPRKGLGQ